MFIQYIKRCNTLDITKTINMSLILLVKVRLWLIRNKTC